MAKFRKRRGRHIDRTSKIANHPRLGEGVYTIPDVSRILGLPQQKARLWLREYWNNRFARGHGYSWGRGRDRAINFYALIEFYVFYQLRNCGVSAQRAAKAHALISRVLKTQYPFATSRILTDGNSIFFSPDVTTLINADPTLQYNLKRIIEDFCVKIDFDNSILARRFFPGGTQGSLVVDPEHQFGQPTILGTNIPAEVLYNFHKAGERVDFIARVYDLTEKQVEDAVAFYTKAA